MRSRIQLPQILLLMFSLLVCFKSNGQEPEQKIETFIKLAEKYADEDNFRESLKYLDSASALNPDYSKIYMVKADIYKDQDQKRRAINEYSTVIRFDPNNADAYFQRSILRNEVGDHRNYSINDINKAISLDPGNTDYYIQKAYFLTSTTYPVPEYSLAIETISQAISIQSDKAEFYNIRAKYKSEAGQRLASLSDYSKAIELDGSNPNYYYDRGLTYYLIEDFESSIDDYNAAIQLDPLNEDYLMGRGQSRFNLNDYETAILDFTLSIDTIYGKISKESGKIPLDHPLNKSLRRAYLYRGSALLQVESNFEACQDFEFAKNLGDNRASQYIKTYCK